MGFIQNDPNYITRELFLEKAKHQRDILGGITPNFPEF